MEARSTTSDITITALSNSSIPTRSSLPWTGLNELELATLEWVDWWNHRRLLGPIGYIPPVELEQSWADAVSQTTSA